MQNLFTISAPLNFSLVRTYELCEFHLSLFNHFDMRSTWDEHGNLAGHIDFRQREILKGQRAAQDRERIQSLLGRYVDYPVLEEFKLVLEDLCLYDHFEVSRGRLASRWKYFLLSGFSRSGGTYLLNEYARMQGVNVMDQHITFSHDFFPSPGCEGAEYSETNLQSYFATLITIARFYGRDCFFRRTVLGALLMPRLRKLARVVPELTLCWRHIIRDIHGVVPSLLKMYQGQDVVKRLADYYNPLNFFDTDFGNIAMYWFMANTSILPTLHGLPFWDRKILAGGDMFGDFERIIAEYVEKNRRHHENYYELGKPHVIKFGKDVEVICNKDFESFGRVETYEAEHFNYKPVPTIDDKYSRFYEIMIAQLTFLYQEFGLEFDGKLDRV